MGVSVCFFVLLCFEADARGEKGYWQQIPGWKLVLARSLIFLMIYCVLAFYYFGFSFDYYNISKLAEPVELIEDFPELEPEDITACLIYAAGKEHQLIQVNVA